MIALKNDQGLGYKNNGARMSFGSSLWWAWGKRRSNTRALWEILTAQKQLQFTAKTQIKIH